MLFLQPLGWIVATAVRRISYDDALEFAEVHRAVYLDLGFRLIDVPALPVAERTDLVHAFLLQQHT